MTTVFGVKGSKPQTHAFIIGIGHYPYLAGGTQAVEQIKTGLSGLEQLTSPQHSALAFYDALIALSNAKALLNPLGSIEMIISDFPGSNTVPLTLQTEPGTKANIRKAYKAWKTRCIENKDNTAIFFFCGHGIEDAEHYLLTEEFGEDPDLPWEGAFNFDRARLALNQANIKTQLFFVDACRKLPIGMLEQDAKIGDIDAPTRIAKSCSELFVLKAAAPNEGSYSKKNQPTFFTNALIKALKGAVSRKISGKWIVTCAGITENIHKLLEAEKFGEGYPERCDCYSRVSATITTWDEPSERKLTVICDPQPALEHAVLSCTNAQDGKLKDRQPPVPETWEIEIPAGIYNLKAHFPTANYRNAENLVTVDLPFNHETLNCS
jgi:hypothetical protein